MVLAFAVRAFTLAAAALSAPVACAGYDVAAYVWPAYQPEPRWKELGIFDEGIGEWQSVKNSARKENGYHWNRKPLWGYVNEADPCVKADSFVEKSDISLRGTLAIIFW